ncbi:unnamed protein product, partial [Ascophyllum nodosum]
MQSGERGRHEVTMTEKVVVAAAAAAAGIIYPTAARYSGQNTEAFLLRRRSSETEAAVGTSTGRVEVAGKGGEEEVAIERICDGNVEMLLANQFVLHVCIVTKNARLKTIHTYTHTHTHAYAD